MKRSLFCLLFVLALAVISRPAPAQEAAAAASNSVVVIDSSAALPIDAPVTAVPPTSSLFSERVTVGVSPIIQSSSDAQAQEAPHGIKGFFFGTQRRTSNTLMIGGVAVAGIGVGVVKGEVGALLGVLGLLGSIGGLYLAF